jgi:hypothetical protein
LALHLIGDSEDSLWAYFVHFAWAFLLILLVVWQSICGKASIVQVFAGSCSLHNIEAFLETLSIALSFNINSAEVRSIAQFFLIYLEGGLVWQLLNLISDHLLEVRVVGSLWLELFVHNFECVRHRVIFTLQCPVTRQNGVVNTLHKHDFVEWIKVLLVQILVPLGDDCWHLGDHTLKHLLCLIQLIEIKGLRLAHGAIFFVDRLPQLRCASSLSLIVLQCRRSGSLLLIILSRLPVEMLVLHVSLVYKELEEV